SCALSLPARSPVLTRYLLSFPTRRSSDLLLRVRAVEQFAVGSGVVGVLLSAGGEDHPVPVGERLRVGLSGPRTAEGPVGPGDRLDRKSTRLNSSHVSISYAVFCLKKIITI